jgi:hypothetical protein
MRPLIHFPAYYPPPKKARGVTAGTQGALVGFTIAPNQAVSLAQIAAQVTAALPPAPTLDYGTPAQATQGTAYTLTPTLTGAGVTVAVSSGSLPAGLSLNSSTGAITGTPTTAGDSTFTVTATNAGGSASQTITVSVAATLASLAAFQADATQAGLIVYTTDAGTTPAANGDDAQAFIPQKMHADDTRWKAEAWDAASKYRNNDIDNINGAPVIEITGSGTAFTRSGTGGGYMSAARYWLALSGRTHDSTMWGFFRAIFSWAGSTAPSNIGPSNGFGVELDPGRAKLKVVHVRQGQTPALVVSSEIDYVRGSVFALGVYYDGTDITIWFRDSSGLQTQAIEAPGDIIINGALVEGMHFFAGNNTGAGFGWDKSACLTGIEDGGDVAAHKARLLAWVNARVPA